MPQTDVLCGNCPQCGEALEIPAHLHEFSCLYCGARLTSTAFSVRPQLEVSEIDAEACASYYRTHVLQVITNHIGIEKEMTRTKYAGAFERYRHANAEIFRQLDLAVSGNAITPEGAAKSFLDQLEDHWSADARWYKSRSSMLEADKFNIAIYLVPMVRSLSLSCGEAYCNALQAQWVARHPQSPFFLGQFEEINGSFQKRFLGLCFITTAVCQQEGKPDDCAELTAFRRFRDGYLRSCPDGPALIAKYYDIAPGIVLRLDLSENRNAKYQEIREQYLDPCYRAILSGDLNQCKKHYIDMMRNLEQEYLH